MKQPHKHAALIKAWADGAEIQFRSHGTIWYDSVNPTWAEDTEYRIKPEPKPDVVDRVFVREGLAIWGSTKPNLRLTFSGETGELIKAEVLK